MVEEICSTQEAKREGLRWGQEYKRKTKQNKIWLFRNGVKNHSAKVLWYVTLHFQRFSSLFSIFLRSIFNLYLIHIFNLRTLWGYAPSSKLIGRQSHSPEKCPIMEHWNGQIKMGVDVNFSSSGTSMCSSQDCPELEKVLMPQRYIKIKTQFSTLLQAFKVCSTLLCYHYKNPIFLLQGY